MTKLRFESYELIDSKSIARHILESSFHSIERIGNCGSRVIDNLDALYFGLMKNLRTNDLDYSFGAGERALQRSIHCSFSSYFLQKLICRLHNPTPGRLYTHCRQNGHSFELRKRFPMLALGLGYYALYLVAKLLCRLTQATAALSILSCRLIFGLLGLLSFNHDTALSLLQKPLDWLVQPIRLFLKRARLSPSRWHQEKWAKDP